MGGGHMRVRCVLGNHMFVMEVFRRLSNLASLKL